MRYSPWQVALEVVSALGPRAKDLSVTLKLEAISPLPLMALMDPTRIRQILMNLVSNAIKFSDSGSEVELASECARQRARRPTSSSSRSRTGASA